MAVNHPAAVSSLRPLAAVIHPARPGADPSGQDAMKEVYSVIANGWIGEYSVMVKDE
jgi:hypothetical protein